MVKRTRRAGGALFNRQTTQKTASWRHKVGLCLFASSLMACCHSALGLSARTDKVQYDPKESIILHLQAAGKHAKNALNLKPLERDFQLFSMRFAHTPDTLKGRSDWTLVLLTKRSGPVQIPVLSVGTQPSEAFMIQIASTSQLTQKRHVILTTRVDSASVYVEGQLVFTQLLYQMDDVTDGLLSEPRIPNAIVKRLGEDDASRQKIQNTTYQVIKRRYVVFPQSPGALVIPSTQYSGRLVHRNDVLTQSMRRPKSKLSVTAEAIKVTVLPIPQGFTSDNWVVASELTLRSTWDSTQAFEVGIPKGQTLTVQAQGLLTTQLPKLSVPSLRAFKAYLEVGSGETTHHAHGLISQKQYRMTYIPLKAGAQMIPEIRLSWWNSRTHKKQFTVLEATPLQVLPGNLVHQQNTKPLTKIVLPTHQPLPTQPAKDYISWSDVSAYLPSLDTALITIGIFWIILHIRAWMSPAHKQHAMREVKQKIITRFTYNIKKGCQTHDSDYVYHQLLAWARSRWPDHVFSNLTHIARQLNNAELNRKISKLNRSRFQPSHEGWNGKSFWRVFKPMVIPPASPTKAETHAADKLPSLYKK